MDFILLFKYWKIYLIKNKKYESNYDVSSSWKSTL